MNGGMSKGAVILRRAGLQICGQASCLLIVKGLHGKIRRQVHHGTGVVCGIRPQNAGVIIDRSEIFSIQLDFQLIFPLFCQQVLDWEYGKDSIVRLPPV